MMNERELLDLKEKINKAKIRSSEFQGQLNHLKEELMNRFGCKTVGEALEKLKESEQGAEEVQNQIDNDLEKIEKEYDV